MNHSDNDEFTTLISMTIPEASTSAIENVSETSFVEMIEIIMLSVCFIIGAPLNLISFYKLYRNFYRCHRPGKKPSHGAAQINLLKLHLNMADLMTLFIYAPAQIGWMITTQWYAGDFFCRIIKFFYAFVFYLTSFVIVCIAIDRVYGAFKLSSVKASKKAYDQCKKLLWGAWIMAMILSLPQLYVFGTMEHPSQPGFEQCVEIRIAMRAEIDFYLNMNITETMYQQLMQNYRATENWQMVYNICHLLFVFWIPAFIIVFSYVAILCIFNSMSKTHDNFKLTSNLYSVLFASGKTSNAVEQHKLENTGERSSTASFTNKLDSEDSNKDSNVIVPESCNTMDSVKFGLLAIEETSDVRKISTMSCIESQKPERRTSMSPSGMIGKRNFQRSHSEQIKSFIFINKSSPTPNNKPVSARSDKSTTKMGPIAIQTIAIARQKTMRQAALILLAYLTCWTPYNIIAIFYLFVPMQTLQESWLLKAIDVSPYLNALIVANAIVNPLIYGVFD